MVRLLSFVRSPTVAVQCPLRRKSNAEEAVVVVIARSGSPGIAKASTLLSGMPKNKRARRECIASYSICSVKKRRGSPPPGRGKIDDDRSGRP
jgi:hypothetical protein